MLRPVETSTREIKKLDGLWSFCLDTADCGMAQQWWKRPLSQSRAIAVVLVALTISSPMLIFAITLGTSGISGRYLFRMGGVTNVLFYGLTRSRIMERSGLTITF